MDILRLGRSFVYEMETMDCDGFCGNFAGWILFCILLGVL